MTIDPKLEVLEHAMLTMLEGGEAITARGLARRAKGVINHASDITRLPSRRALFEKYQSMQRGLQAAAQKAEKQSKAALRSEIERKNLEIARLKQERDVLILSHRAMILGVGELGGIRTWSRFFKNYQRIVDELNDLGAVPSKITSILTHEKFSRGEKASPSEQ